jgi:pimeloyl-ACP methyl ester carboxylesterase
MIRQRFDGNPEALSMLRLLMSFTILGLVAPLALAQPMPGDPKEETAETADGVKLRCRFYAATKEGNGSCAILMGDYTADPNAAQWDNLARFLAKDCGINVMRFDWRGHGQSKDVIPDKFWKESWNQLKVTGYNRKPIKASIDFKDFKADYFGMLVNDLMAVRTLLDQKNDDRKVNTRTVYLIATGSAAPLAQFFLAVEWNRQSVKPLPTGVALAVPDIIRSNGRRQPGTDVAGKDYAGVVLLSPSRSFNYEYGTQKGKSSIPNQIMKDFVSKYSKDIQGGGDLRGSTGMLFIVGEKDADGVKDATFFHTDVMAADAKSSKLEPMKNTKLIQLKGAKERGVELLDKRNSLKTEDLIQAFIEKIEGDRKRLNPTDRKYDKPWRVDLGSFGVGNS